MVLQAVMVFCSASTKRLQSRIEINQQSKLEKCKLNKNKNKFFQTKREVTKNSPNIWNVGHVLEDSPQRNNLDITV